MDRSARSSPRNGAATREAFVEATGRLLRRQGYAASGLNEIVTRSGAPKGSLYFHFPGGKEELVVVAMQTTGRTLEAGIDAVLAAHDRPADGIGALIDAMGAGLEASGYRDGCPIATVTLETASASAAIRETAANVFEAWTQAIERRLLQGGASRARARSRAVLALSAIEGALILARARGEIAPLLSVRDELCELLG